jgi:hypothetical protein
MKENKLIEIKNKVEAITRVMQKLITNYSLLEKWLLGV